MQFQNRISLFACEEAAIYSNKAIKGRATGKTYDYIYIYIYIYICI